MNPFSTKEGVNLPFHEAGVKVTADAFGDPPGVNEEALEGVDDRVCSFRTKTIDPRVAGRELDEGKSVFVTARTSSFAVPNIHTYGMKRMPGSGKEFAVTVTVDGGHIPNG